MPSQLLAHQLYEHCMAVYQGQMDIDTFSTWLRHIFGWWIEQTRSIIELCQAN